MVGDTVENAGKDKANGQCRVVLVSCPEADAGRIAQALVEARQAACVNALPGMRSVYRWQGKVETAAESLLLIKTTAAAYPALEQAVRELHPYELPEILAFNPANGLAGYLAWVNECVRVD